jgi:hypothetical protein
MEYLEMNPPHFPDTVRRRLNDEHNKLVEGYVKGQALNPDAIAHPVDRELMEALDNAHLFTVPWGLL